MGGSSGNLPVIIGALGVITTGIAAIKGLIGSTVGIRLGVEKMAWK